MVNAQEFTPSAITHAIRCGNFYSSCGPELHSITFDGNQLHLETSPVRFMRIVGPGWNGSRTGSFDGQLINHASFPLPDDWQYVYLEIEDQDGLRAWSNNLFIDNPIY